MINAAQPNRANADVGAAPVDDSAVIGTPPSLASLSHRVSQGGVSSATSSLRPATSSIMSRDEGMARVRSCLDGAEISGGLAPFGRACSRCRGGALAVFLPAEISARGDDQPAHRVSAMDRRAAAACDPKISSQPGLDGAGVCAFSPLDPQEYR